MSLLNQIYATPSRIKGVIQLFAELGRQRLKRTTIEGLLSPKTLPANAGGGRLMVAAVLNECIDLELLDGQDPENAGEGPRLRSKDALLQLAPRWLPSFPNSSHVAAQLPRVLREQVFSPTNNANEDLAAAVAWYLAQDVLEAPGEWESFGAALTTAGLQEAFRFNDNKFQMLSYWAPYLGFANTCAVPVPSNSAGRQWMAPDPAACLREVLADVLTEFGGAVRLTACMEAVAKRCPAFEGGALRARMEANAPSRPSTHLSSTTSHALLRLQEERTITLELRHDADALVLVDGNAARSYSDIRWNDTVRRAE